MKFNLPCGCCFELRKKLVFAEPIEWYLDQDSKVHKVCDKHDKQLSVEEWNRYLDKKEKDRKLYDVWAMKVLNINTHCRIKIANE